MPNLFRATMGGGGSDIEPYIVIVTLNEDFAGQTVTLEQDGQDTLRATCPMSAPFEVAFKPLHDGVWIAKSTTIDGRKSVASTEPLLEWKTYYIELTSGFNFITWLTQGRVTETFDSLDDVLADEKTIRQLMTVHDSVDFLANNVTDEDATKIFSNDLCAKWINLRDYALDTLYANDTCKSAMDSADKYFYGEWALVGQVPKLSADNDNIICFAHYDSNNPYYAFDESNATFWWGDGISSTDIAKDYIGYSFDKPIEISKVIFSHYQSGAKRNSKLRIEYSDDKVAWYNATEDSPTSDVTTPQSVDVPPCGEHKYWRAFFTKNNPSTDANVKIASIQFYAWQPKGNIPIMTSATAPYGVVSTNADFSANYAGWKAFNGSMSSDTDRWSNEVDNSWIQYKFVSPNIIKKASFIPWGLQAQESFYVMVNFSAYIIGSNDGSVWSDPLGEITVADGDKELFRVYNIDLDNDTPYLYYRFVYVGHNGTHKSYSSSKWCQLVSLQFYGRELSVSVPKMDTDNTPYGEASMFDFANGNPKSAYAVFDKVIDSSSTRNYITLKAGTGYFQYKFPKKVVAKAFSITTPIDASTYKITQGIRVECFNEGGEPIEVARTSETLDKNITTYMYEINNPNNDEYQYFRFRLNNTTDMRGVSEINFYGLDYSERDFDTESPSKYIYDHGVELEEITLSQGGSGAITKKPYEIYAEIITSTTNSYFIAYSNKIDLSQYEYKNIRVVVGDEISIDTSKSQSAGAIATYKTEPNNYNDIQDSNKRYTVIGIGGTVDNPYTISSEIANVKNETYVAVFSNWSSATQLNRRFSFRELWLE